METAKKEIYIKTTKPQPDLSEPYDGDTLEGNNEFMKELQENESQRVEMNETFISMLENDLEHYDMMLVESKTIKDIYQVELLVLMRLRALEKSINLTDEDKDRFQNSIDSAKQLLEIIDAKKAVLQTDEKKKYPFNQKLLKTIYDYCKYTNPIFTNSVAEFYIAVETANFSELKPTVSNERKIVNLIYYIKKEKIMNSDWYTDVVASIGLKKKDCYHDNCAWYDDLVDYCDVPVD